MKKWLGFLLAMVMLCTMCATPALAAGPTPEEFWGGEWQPIDSDVEGELDVMFWSGDGSYLKDVGHQDYTPEELTGYNQAWVYYTAKVFNKYYPNVKINIYAKEGSEGDWPQELENFKNEHGKYPDIFGSGNCIRELQKGLIADLSVFEGTPMYEAFNKKYMNMMNVYGFQVGVPNYILPWGIFINRALAEENNIEVPEPDWTMDEYVNFVLQAEGKDFWGTSDVFTDIFACGCDDVYIQMAKANGKAPFLDLTTDAFKKLLAYTPELAKVALWEQQYVGNVSDEVMDEFWWWDSYFFSQNKLLTNEQSPWMLGDSATTVEDGYLVVQSDDWDIYPFPSSDERGNYIMVVSDPQCLFNFAQTDSDPAWSDAEKQQLNLAWTYMYYMLADTECYEATAKSLWNNQGALMPVVSDSLPLVNGEAFDEQMKMWFDNANHERLADKEKFRGFNRMLELYQTDDTPDISGKSYPLYTTVDGTDLCALDELWYMYSPDFNNGLHMADPGWLDQAMSQLSDWTQKMNDKMELCFANTKEALIQYYGYTAEDFE